MSVSTQSSTSKASVSIKGGTDGTIIGNSDDRLKAEIVESFDDKVEQGEAFVHSSSKVMSNNEVKEFTIYVPADCDMSFLYDVTGSKETQVELFENTTFTGGTTVTTYNRNRNSTNTLDATVKEDPTILTDGTVLEDFQTGASGGRKGSSESRDKRWILKCSTYYLIRITSLNSTNPISWMLNLWEG
jgi:hypothetical protein